MRIIAFIEDYKVIKKILDYLGIYDSMKIQFLDFIVLKKRSAPPLRSL